MPEDSKPRSSLSYSLSTGLPLGLPTLTPSPERPSVDGLRPGSTSATSTAKDTQTEETCRSEAVRSRDARDPTRYSSLLPSNHKEVKAILQRYETEKPESGRGSEGFFSTLFAKLLMTNNKKTSRDDGRGSETALSYKFD